MHLDERDDRINCFRLSDKQLAQKGGQAIWVLGNDRPS
jgi:hypothetical protein